MREPQCAGDWIRTDHTMMLGNLTSSRLSLALQRLEVLAASEQLVLELALCYGRVIVVVFNCTHSAVVDHRMLEPRSRATALVRLVAEEQRLPANWLKDEVQYTLVLFAIGDRTNLNVFGPNLIISLAEPEHILAMKLRICQMSPLPVADFEDLAFLLEKTGRSSPEALEGIFKQYFAGESLEDSLRNAITGIAAPAVMPKASLPMESLPMTPVLSSALPIKFDESLCAHYRVPLSGYSKLVWRLCSSRTTRCVRYFILFITSHYFQDDHHCLARIAECRRRREITEEIELLREVYSHRKIWRLFGIGLSEHKLLDQFDRITAREDFEGRNRLFHPTALLEHRSEDVLRQ